MCQNCQGTMVFLFTIFWGIAHSGITSVIQSWTFSNKAIWSFLSKGWGTSHPMLNLLQSHEINISN